MPLIISRGYDTLTLYAVTAFRRRCLLFIMRAIMPP